MSGLHSAGHFRFINRGRKRLKRKERTQKDAGTNSHKDYPVLWVWREGQGWEMGQADRLQWQDKPGWFWVLNWENWETLKPQKKWGGENRLGQARREAHFPWQHTVFSQLWLTLSVPGAGASPCWSLLQRNSVMKKKDPGVPKKPISPLYIISLNALPPKEMKPKFDSIQIQFT